MHKTASNVRPFLKWAGGKRRLLEQYSPYFPPITDIKHYFEPFIGSAAVFFHLQPRLATLSDRNQKLIEVGDRLSYTVLEDRQNPSVLFVDDDGMIDVPLIGSYEVKGKTQYEASFEIKVLLEEEYYYQATVLLTFFDESVLGGQVTLLGQVSNQGSMDIPPGEVFTVSKAILRAGGFSVGADPARVRVIRRDPEDMRKEIKIDVNVAAILQTGDLEKDIVVKPLDTIFVPTKGLENGQIFVVGEVNAPNTYPLPAGERFTVTQAILKAGGFTDFANQKRVKPVRGDESLPDSERTIEVNVRKILSEGDRKLDPQLEDKDMIIVEENWINF